jgi:hypothetical protein
MPSLESTRPATARVRLARIAERVVEADARVTATAQGVRWVTRDGDRTIAGVVVAESASGAVDMGLHLIVAAPTEPLEGLAAELRQAIADGARRDSLAERLGTIDVAFHDVAIPTPEEAHP